METKIAVIAIIISDKDAVESINNTLHEFSEYFIGRLGIPYKQKGVNVITAVLDAHIEIINGISGKLGMIKGVKSKVLMTK